MNNTEIPRFIKWAGGKVQLINQFIPFFPKKIDRYFEPFLGSGAVFFYIIQTFKPKEVYLSDTNEELINAYNVIKNDVEILICELEQHKKNHVNQGKEYYYSIRKQNPNDFDNLKKAARFIYLNKTCFNGLYRVNSKGEFNVPIGSYKNPDVVQADKLRKISKLLQNVSIEVKSFEQVLKNAKKGDFIYLDPPYYPLKKGKSFTKYAKSNFLEKEQESLAEVFKELDKKGCLLMLSNSDTDFIKKLYPTFHIDIVKANRMINCDATKRGEINEIVVTNYLKSHQFHF